MSKKLNKSSKGVAHHSPGRTRLKVPKSHRHRLHEIKSELENKPGVTHVELNHETGSVLVKHEHDAPIFEMMHKAVETVEVDLLTTLIEGEAVELVGGASIIAAGVGLLGTVAKSFFGSRQEGAAPSVTPLLTGQASDLKTIVPTAFLVAALVKAYETRSFWQGITPLALAYWAFDTYWRFNVANPAVFEPKNGKSDGHGNGHGHSHGGGHGNHEKQA